MHHVALCWILAICLFNSVNASGPVFYLLIYLFSNIGGRSKRPVLAHQSLVGKWAALHWSRPCQGFFVIRFSTNCHAYSDSELYPSSFNCLGTWGVQATTVPHLQPLCFEDTRLLSWFAIASWRWHKKCPAEVKSQPCGPCLSVSCFWC